MLLAGPIVRRVTPRSVSVWVATSGPSTLRLSIFDGLTPVGPGGGLVTSPSPRNTSSPQETVRVGNGLHVGVVTLVIPPEQPQLQFGQVYSYNVTITGNGITVDLKSLGLLAAGPLVLEEGPPKPHLPLGYDTNTLPSFVTPPASLDDVRLYHASCRKPHGQDPDALAFLDEQIDTARGFDPIHRPHQLFLTGDQIYADDVPISLLPHLTAVGRQLIGTDERLPLDAGDVVVNERTLPAGLRAWFVRKFMGFSSSAADSHLISLGEYCASYLFSWSNILWPDMETPHAEDATIPKSLADIPHGYDIDPNHLEPDGGPVLPIEDFALRHPIFEKPASAALILFFNNLTHDEREALESDDFDEKKRKNLVGLAGSARNPPANFRFLVDQARIMAQMPLLNVNPKRTIELFFWIANRRRKAWQQVRTSKPSEKFLRHTIANYYDSLPKVRRALANVATYMIFDDHDVTDDWYVSRPWRARVHARPLGRAVMRNALVAYGMFQGWGNDPDQFGFAPGGPNGPLLGQVPELYDGTAVPDGVAAAALDSLFGLDDSTPATRWHFEVPSTVFRTVVLDTRTRREFLGLRGPPNLISPASLDTQLPKGPLEAGKQVLIVISAAPVLDLAVLEEIVKPIAIRALDAKHVHEAWKKGKKPVLEGAMELDLESWSANPAGFEALLARLATYKHVLVLSGDVHYGASADLSYWHKDIEQPARIVQFTSSPAKNRIPGGDLIFLLARSSFAQRVQRLDVPLKRLAWADSSTEPVELSTTESTPPSLRARLNRSPVLLPTYGWPEGTVFTQILPLVGLPAGAEWSWSLRLLQDKRLDLERPPFVHPLPIDLDEPVTESNAFEAYRKVARRHAESLDKALFARQMVFATNIGRVSFETSNGTITARQDLLAVHPEDPFSTPAPYTRHEASLDPTGDEPPVPEVGGG